MTASFVSGAGSFRPLAGCELFHQLHPDHLSLRVTVPLRGVSCFAFDKCDEADYYQEKLDRLLREAYGDDIKEGFFGFHDRYECVKKQDYFTGKWK